MSLAHSKNPLYAVSTALTAPRLSGRENEGGKREREEVQDQVHVHGDNVRRLIRL